MEKLIINGKESETSDLKVLARSLEVGQKIHGAYRYFLFGQQERRSSVQMPFELERRSKNLAVMHHLQKNHRIAI